MSSKVDLNPTISIITFKWKWFNNSSEKAEITRTDKQAYKKSTSNVKTQMLKVGGWMGYSK